MQLLDQTNHFYSFVQAVKTSYAKVISVEKCASSAYMCREYFATDAFNFVEHAGFSIASPATAHVIF